MMATLVSRALRSLRTRFRASRARARARQASQERLAGAPIRRVLVICYGNIYRSAFVGAYLRNRLPATIEIRSAGFHRKTGRPSPESHVEMSRRFGVDLAAHRSALVCAGDLEWADTILLMDRHNWAALDAMGADPAKCVWLGALLPGEVEIVDPYSLDPEAALAVVSRLHQASQLFADGVLVRLSAT